MRILFTACALVFLAACASTPPAADAGNSPEAAPPVSEAERQSAADRKFAEAVRSYQVVEKDGETLYCRSERSTGSKLQSFNCINEAALRLRIQEAEAMRRGRPAVCGPNDPRCGGGVQ